jgi:hypothetical protein
MIESLTITDFQCHEQISIEFDPLVTTIIADGNDKGKSAVLRCLRWVCTNKPPKGTQPDDFIRWGAKKARGKLRVDGHIIRRVKGDGANFYDLDTNKLAAPGKGDPPESIQNIVNVGPQNWQRQHDNPFWFLETPGEVSRELNRIVNLELIDRTLGNIAARLKSKRTELRICNERVETAREKKKKLAWIVEMDEELQMLETMQIQLSETTKRSIELSSLIGQLAQTRRGFKGWVKSRQEGLALVEKAEQIFVLQKQRKELENILKTIKSWRDSIKDVPKERKMVEEELHNRLQGQCPICGQTIKKGKNQWLRN